ncbi:MAG: lysophospholipid acyltransferase family protein [Anaerolineales bacterium]
MSAWLRVKRRIFRFLATALAHILARMDMSGLERIRDSKGTVVLVCNHLGRFDALLTLALVRRDDLIVVVAEKYRKYAFARWMAKTLDMLFLERFDSDIGTLKEVLRRLQRGGILVISPEGTRSPTEALLEGKPGAAYLVGKTGATVIPVGVTGTEDRAASERLRRFRRLHIRVVVGRPFQMPLIPRENRDQYLQQYTDEIMAQIAALLPKEYRGVYENHPRVAELIA